MRLMELELKGFKPLSLSNIEHFHWTPKNPLQVVLGTNGSGKSSLLRASSPTFTNKNEYRSGGYEKAIWEGNDHCIYTITTSYSGSSPTYSFQVEEDGETKELNPGGTAKVQKDLIESKIGYSQSLHELLCQHTKFTQMGPKQREELMHLLTGDRLDFAYKLFDGLRTRQRDTVGALKHLSAKYSEFCARVNAMGDMEKVISHVKRLEKASEGLVDQTNWSLNGVNPSQAVLQETQGKMEHWTRKAELGESQVKQGLSQLGKRFPSYDTFLNELNQQEANLTSLKSRRIDVEQKLADLKQLLKALDECPEDVDEARLEAHVNELVEQTKTFEKKWVGDVNLTQGIKECETLRQDMVMLQSQMPTSLQEYSQDQVRHIRKTETELRLIVGDLKRKIAKRDEIILHAKLAANDNIECPHCHQTILATGSLPSDTLLQYEMQLQAMNEDLEKLELKHRVSQESLNDLNTYMKFRGMLVERLREHSWMADIWQSMGTVGHVLMNLSVLINRLDQQLDYLREGVQHEKAQEELVKYQEYLRIIRLTKGNDTKVQMKGLYAEYNDLVAQQNQANALSLLFKQIAKGYQEWFEAGDQLNQLVITYQKAFRDWLSNEQTLVVNDRVKAIQTELGDLRRNLLEYQNLSQRRDELEKEGKALQLEQDDLKALIKAVSPQTGFIGDQIRETARIFSDYINRTIAKIWEHPLSVRVPKSKGGFDYRFELVVNGEVREDIKLGSDGEQDVINLAVTLAVMERKHLKGYPLWLDEFGNRFDSAHRLNLMQFIENLLRTGRIGQIFMINHFLSDYSGLEDSDFIVMNANNVQLGDLVYNQVVTMQ